MIFCQNDIFMFIIMSRDPKYHLCYRNLKDLMYMCVCNLNFFFILIIVHNLALCPWYKVVIFSNFGIKTVNNNKYKNIFFLLCSIVIKYYMIIFYGLRFEKYINTIHLH